MERRRLRRIGITLATSGLLLLGVAMAPPATATNQSDGYVVELESVVYDSEADTTTYTWSLNHATRSDPASHLLIDTCLGDTATDTDPEADDYNGTGNPDPTTGSTGYKWENDPAVGDTFSITYAGEWGDTGESTWTVKKGTGYVTGTTGGPSCDEPEPVGSFVVSKTVAGPYSGPDFSFDVACGPDDSEIVEASTIEGEAVAAAFTETIELGHGESKTYSDLPAGWVCSADETDSNDAVSVVVSDTTTPTADGVVVIAADATSRVDVTNEFAEILPATFGSLRVSKTVVGTSTETFPFTVACTNAGSAVTLAAGDASFGLAHGQNKVISGIPTGSSCTVTETDAKGAVATVIADSSGTATDGVVTIAADTQSTVDVTNTIAEVLGVVFTQELPRTGITTTGLTALAGLLLASGALMLMVSRSREETP